MLTKFGKYVFIQSTIFVLLHDFWNHFPPSHNATFSICRHMSFIRYPSFCYSIPRLPIIIRTTSIRYSGLSRISYASCRYFCIFSVLLFLTFLSIGFATSAGNVFLLLLTSSFKSSLPVPVVFLTWYSKFLAIATHFPLIPFLYFTFLWTKQLFSVEILQLWPIRQQIQWCQYHQQILHHLLPLANTISIYHLFDSKYHRHQIPSYYHHTIILMYTFIWILKHCIPISNVDPPKR